MKFIFTIVVIATLQFQLACSTTNKPKTNTQVPSLSVSKEMTKQLRANLQDAKDGVHRARTLNERIDYKASILE